MAQVENLRVIMEGSRDLFREATFNMPDRISDKGFKWLTIYTIALGAILFLASTIAESLGSKYWIPSWYWVVVSIAIVCTILLLFFLARSIILMLEVVHVSKNESIDFQPPLKEVWSKPDLTEETLLYAVALKYLEPAEANFNVSVERYSKMISSYKTFYLAVALEVVLFIIAKIQIFYYNGNW